MDQQTRILALRLLNDQVTEKTNKNNAIRGPFGDRIPTHLAGECVQRDREIAALNATIGLIEAEPEPA